MAVVHQKIYFVAVIGIFFATLLASSEGAWVIITMVSTHKGLCFPEYRFLRFRYSPPGMVRTLLSDHLCIQTA